jgi:hypothetical protein
MEAYTYRYLRTYRNHRWCSSRIETCLLCLQLPAYSRVSPLLGHQINLLIEMGGGLLAYPFLLLLKARGRKIKYKPVQIHSIYHCQRHALQSPTQV